MTTTAPAPEPGTVRPSPARWPMLLAVLVAIGVGAALTAVIMTRGDTPANTSPATRLTQVQASCVDWMTSSQTDGLSDHEWCTNMFAWMSDQSGGSMMRSTMWQGPEQMGQACREWVTQDRADAGASGQQRCGDMVEWMDRHMSSRGGDWMMPGR